MSKKDLEYLIISVLFCLFACYVGCWTGEKIGRKNARTERILQREGTTIHLCDICGKQVEERGYNLQVMWQYEKN